MKCDQLYIKEKRIFQKELSSLSIKYSASFVKSELIMNIETDSGFSSNIQLACVSSIFPTLY